MSDAEFVAALERGIALFDRQEYVAAYEVWEAQWAQEQSEGANLLQGLLQLAVGLEKLQSGQTPGAQKLLAGGAAILDAYRPESYGVDVDALLCRVRQWQALAGGRQ
jgi:predicted metal-dependent hydrolase